MDAIQIFSVAGSFILLCVIIYLVRTSRLKVKYSLIWILASIVILLFSSNRNLLEQTADFLDVYYPPSFLFLIGLFFMLAILLHFSLIISRLSEQNKILAQDLALLRKKVENGEKKITKASNK